MILLVLNANAGDVERYVGRVRTHSATANRKVHFLQEFVTKFRDDPPEQFRVAPDPSPVTPGGKAA